MPTYSHTQARRNKDAGSRPNFTEIEHYLKNGMHATASAQHLSNNLVIRCAHDGMYTYDVMHLCIRVSDELPRLIFVYIYIYIHILKNMRMRLQSVMCIRVRVCNV